MELAKDQALSNPETAAEVNASAASETTEAKLEQASVTPAEPKTEAAAEPATIEPAPATTEASEKPAEATPETATDAVAASEPATVPTGTAETSVAAHGTTPGAVEIIPPAAADTAAGEAETSQAAPILGQLIPRRAASRGPKMAPPIRPEHRSEARPRSRAARYALLAASVTLAICIGAAAGAAGFATMAKLQPEPPKPPMLVQKTDSGAEIKALKESVAQLRTSVRTLNDSLTQLRTGADSTGKAAQGQIVRLNEAMERLEKSQAEPNARLAKITEALDRIDRRTATPALAAASAPETTGSIRQTPPPLQTDTRAGKPVAEGWSLLEVHNGVALVQSRVGAYEVIVGDDIRGLGRVQDIRRQDGRWVVVTARGLIMPQR